MSDVGIIWQEFQSYHHKNPSASIINSLETNEKN
jgi:hypothetical protein